MAALDAAGIGTDRDFRHQLERSARSVAANIAEGFGYFEPTQFARYLRIARGSTMETRSHLTEGAQRLLRREDADRLLTLTTRLLAGISRLIRYLERCAPTRRTAKSIEG